ncbi:MAG: hypothetical protein Q8P28_02020 [Deltaproteobacteria bacterium]|nr:hypothetical protein [Deltaproteobacteria bacterium]
MKQVLKIILISSLFMVLFGSMLLALPGKTDGSDWTEGKLVKIIGLDSAAADKAKKPDLSKIEMMMDGGNIFGLSPDVRIKDAKGNYISIDTLEPPYEVRYIAEDMMIKEINIIKVIPK